MGYYITGTDITLFGEYNIMAIIEDDGTIVEASPWKRILGHVCEDGTITDHGAGYRRILDILRKMGR